MYLGVDIGTSAVKAVMIGAEGEVVGEGSAPIETSNPRPYWSEQDPEDWWLAVIEALSQIPHRVKSRAVGLSGQMHGAVLIDQYGHVIRPAILWNDGRAHEEAAELAAQSGLAERAGVTPMPGLTAPKIMWVRKHAPAAYARIARVLLPKDYIGFRMHGGFFTDTSDAAGTLWFDQRSRIWSPRLCDISATDPAWLPTILDGASVAGTLSRRASVALGLPAGLPVMAGAGDTAAGAVGMGNILPGRSMLGLGTSGQIVVVTDGYRPHPAGGLHAFAHTVPGQWYQMAAMQNGARPLGWFAAVANRPLPDLLALAARADPERAPIFLPYLTGERTPHDDPHIRGAFMGLDDATDAAAMMRGVVDSVAYSFADAAAALADAGTTLHAPFVTGGGARSALLLQTLADVLATSIHKPAGAAQGAAYGAARLAAHGDGAISLFDLARPPETAERYEPNSGANFRHAERLARFRALYRAIRGI